MCAQLLFATAVMMLLKGHKQRYHKRLFLSKDSAEFKVQHAPFVCRARHLKKKMVVQTPRLRIEEIASGISRLGISTGDQEKIMWNFQVF